MASLFQINEKILFQMEPVSEEVRHHGSAVRPVQAEPSGVQAREAQYLRPARREGGTAQVGVITILFERKKVLYNHSLIRSIFSEMLSAKA